MSNQTTTKRTARRAVAAALAGITAFTVVGGGVAMSPAGASELPDGAVVVDVEGATRSDDEVRAELEAVMAGLRADGVLIETDGPTAHQANIIDEMALNFGKQLFGRISDGAETALLTPLLEAMGMGGDPVTESLDQIKVSIDDLRKDISTIAGKIDDLLDGQRESNFYTAYGKSADSAKVLGTLMASVNGWSKNGTTPTEGNISETQTAVLLAMSLLQVDAADATVGAIPLSMKARPERVSDLESYWSDLERMRSSFRTALAQGLVTLELLSQFDESGTVASDLALAVELSLEAVDEMYAFGVGIDQITARSSGLVSFPGSDVVYAPADHVGVDGEDWVDVSFDRAELEPVLADLVDRYDPDAHGGVTLEQYLRERGYETRVTYAGTFGMTTRDGGANWVYTPTATVGAVVGNSYSRSVVPLGPETTDKSKAQAALDLAKATVEGRTALRTLQVEPGTDIDLEAPMATTSRFVHQRNDDTIYAPVIPTSDEEQRWSGVESTSAALKPVYKAMAASYDPRANGGQTLQQYLEQRGIATTVWYADTAKVVKTDQGRYWDHQAWATRGSIVGNSYVEASVPLGSAQRDKAGSDAATAQVSQLKAALAMAPALYARTVDLDAGGHAASFDPDAIRQAAYGAPNQE